MIDAKTGKEMNNGHRRRNENMLIKLTEFNYRSPAAVERRAEARKQANTLRIENNERIKAGRAA